MLSTANQRGPEKIEGGTKVTKRPNSISTWDVGTKKATLYKDNMDYKHISPHELASLLKVHQSMRLPEYSAMFPWLHSYSTTHPPTYPDAISIIRSNVLSQEHNWIPNSGMLKSSMDPSDFLISWNEQCSFDILKYDNDSDNEEIFSLIKDLIMNESATIVVDLLNAEQLANICMKNKVLPFLKTDLHAFRTYCDKSRNKSVNSSFQPLHSGNDSGQTNWRQQNSSFRRFDLQCAKMVELSSKIIIYCLNIDPLAHDHSGCTDCFQLASLLKLALLLLRRHYSAVHYPFEDTLEITILKFERFDKFPLGSVATKPMLLSSTEKQTPQQVSSMFDVISFNNWDRNLLYHEQLEMTKVSSMTSVDSTYDLWCGNLTDYQLYKIFGPYKNLGKVENYPCYYSPDNTIVRLSQLEFDSDDTLKNDSKLFNIPITNVPLNLFIRCSEKSGLPDVASLISNLNSNEGAITFNFPGSGTIGLGNLNINSVEIILNVCYSIYRYSKMHKRGALIYCTDGYSETSFLLVAYLIFLWDLSLEEVMLKLHSECRRPFYLYQIDLQVLGHLQTLLRNYSPRREENSVSYNCSNGSTPLKISPETFSNIFLAKIPMTMANWTKLNGPLPSRILPHLYLGSLEHAQSPILLKRLGITHIVSVGEELSWLGDPSDSIRRNRGVSSPSPPIIQEINEVSSTYMTPRRATMRTDSYDINLPKSSSTKIIEKNGFKICKINNLQDNGIDPLSKPLNDILEFIDDCYKKKIGKVLVHCMVGVSRSATVCIAEVMKRMKVDVLKAYLYVRVRRLNIIIQPNLMFMYELIKWQEELGVERLVDWHIMCRSIVELNKKYL
ncbi:hypothetical protein KAFR_0C04160 [Kazachstania africana CBS 2517]|uniref:Uncharacterized protein n=1 Tax=Kazachstania africana (strain ATCC 22294 / BCRC 22015 / CBS 2517 / CECT 1963 / NBRC 1671 / NRRL Y-8276) TaxID=1071382 RepID=H2ASQ7_KAZAF|nr:hypothetical protein KAFR_0C04160 [Kazachstania africana CBS 2517]CCF57407.1 hypothetical protein KAFR_0C04160 [Kazachstania africana CBS 2517]